jgi:hypothetical protein
LEQGDHIYHRKEMHLTLVVDSTGVGAPVADLFTKKGVRFVGVTITGGYTVTTAGARKYRVPKRDLISALEAHFHSGELQVAEGLELWPTLKKEFLNFRRKINLKTAHNSYEHWRRGGPRRLGVGVRLGRLVRPAHDGGDTRPEDTLRRSREYTPKMMPTWVRGLSCSSSTPCHIQHAGFTACLVHSILCSQENPLHTLQRSQ